jgi:hypothetical protein
MTARTSATTCPMIASAAPVLRRELAKLKIMSEAASGTAGISQRLVTIQGFMANAEWRKSNGAQAPEQAASSSFELVEFIDVGRSIVAVDGDNQGQPNGCFRGGDRDGKNRDHHAGG